MPTSPMHWQLGNYTQVSKLFHLQPMLGKHQLWVKWETELENISLRQSKNCGAVTTPNKSNLEEKMKAQEFIHWNLVLIKAIYSKVR